MIVHLVGREHRVDGLGAGGGASDAEHRGAEGVRPHGHLRADVAHADHEPRGGVDLPVLLLAPNPLALGRPASVASLEVVEHRRQDVLGDGNGVDVGVRHPGAAPQQGVEGGHVGARRRRLHPSHGVGPEDGIEEEPSESEVEQYVGGEPGDVGVDVG